MEVGSIVDSASKSEGTDWGGWAAGAGGGLIGGLTSFYQPFISQNWASNAGNQAFDLQRWWAVNSPSLAVKGLLKAGLNPVLALSKGMGSGGASTPVPHASFDADGDAIGRGVSSARAAGSLRDQLAILRNESMSSGFRMEQERSNVFRAAAEARGAESQAAIAEANREIVDASKAASITSAQQGALQAETTTQQLRVQLELLRSQQPSADALRAFDASEEGQLLIKMRRGVDLAPKIRAGALGKFGVE